MTDAIDVYWSFRSPYSYLVTPDLSRLRTDYDVDVRMRIVYPIAIREPSLVFDPANRNKPLYIVRDSQRRAEFLGLPFARPRPDPIVQDPASMAVATEQPYISSPQRTWRRSRAPWPRARVRHRGIRAHL